MRRFVLLDRDGTLNIEKDYLSNPDDLELTHNAGFALAQLQKSGYGLVVLTNQSGIARGYFDRSQVELIHRRLAELLDQYGVKLDGIYLCPHGPKEDCPCRKPRTGMVEQAVNDLGFNPHHAFMIGDKRADLELGVSIGATPILVRTGYGQITQSEIPAGLATHIADDLAAATQWILSPAPEETP